MDLTELLGYNTRKCLSEQAISEGLLKFPAAPKMSSNLQLEKKNDTLKGEKWHPHSNAVIWSMFLWVSDVLNQTL